MTFQKSLGLMIFLMTTVGLLPHAAFAIPSGFYRTLDDGPRCNIFRLTFNGSSRAFVTSIDCNEGHNKPVDTAYALRCSNGICRGTMKIRNSYDSAQKDNVSVVLNLKDEAQPRISLDGTEADVPLVISAAPQSPQLNYSFACSYSVTLPQAHRELLKRSEIIPAQLQSIANESGIYSAYHLSDSGEQSRFVYADAFELFEHSNRKVDRFSSIYSNGDDLIVGLSTPTAFLLLDKAGGVRLQNFAPFVRTSRCAHDLPLTSCVDIRTFPPADETPVKSRYPDFYFPNSGSLIPPQATMTERIIHGAHPSEDVQIQAQCQLE